MTRRPSPLKGVLTAFLIGILVSPFATMLFWHQNPMARPLVSILWGIGCGCSVAMWVRVFQETRDSRRKRALLDSCELAEREARRRGGED